jgi:molybdate transport system substrate-binding protein
MNRASFQCVAGVLVLFLWGAFSSVALAGAVAVRVAVASNFSGTAEQLAAVFAKKTGTMVQTASGSTGKLYAQITQGAPFDIFLAADQDAPRRLEAQGLAVKGSRFTYAQGQLALWSLDPKLSLDEGKALSEKKFRHLALANPELAPFGRAALQVLEKFGLVETTRPRWVFGENIAQSFQFISTGNAELGFVAYSQVISNPQKGFVWRVPAAMHDPIQQDAVLLVRAEKSKEARSFLEFLKTDLAKSLMRKAGYH